MHLLSVVKVKGEDTLDSNSCDISLLVSETRDLEGHRIVLRVKVVIGEGHKDLVITGDRHGCLIDKHMPWVDHNVKATGEVFQSETEVEVAAFVSCNVGLMDGSLHFKVYKCLLLNTSLVIK